MSKKQTTDLIEGLQLTLEYSNHMLDNKKSHAEIIGYLQGVLEGAINNLKINNE